MRHPIEMAELPPKQDLESFAVAASEPDVSSCPNNAQASQSAG